MRRLTRTPGSRALLAAASSCLMALLGVVSGSGQATAASGTATGVAIPYGSSGWVHLQTRYADTLPFETANYDDRAWSPGAAPFGSTGGSCTWNTNATIRTGWTPETDLLVRQRFTLPPGATHVHIAGSVDNDVTVFVNGISVGQVLQDNCAQGGIQLDVPADDVSTRNVIAVRAADRGFDSFLDLQVTYTPAAKAPRPVSLLAGQTVFTRGAARYPTTGTTCTDGFAVSRHGQKSMLLARRCLAGQPVTDVQTKPTAGAGIVGFQISCGPPVLVSCRSLAWRPVAVLAPKTKVGAYPYGDYVAWLPNAGVVPAGKVRTAKGVLPVRGSKVPRIGDRVCHFGSNAEHCGVMSIVDKNGWLGVTGRSKTTDAGGPAYEYVLNARHKAVAVVAVGVVEAPYFVNRQGRVVAGTWLAPIRVVLKSLGVALVTSR